MSNYTPPTLTVDAVIFRLKNDCLEVLLIKRAKEPFKGQYALPGSYSAAGETSTESFERTLRVKAGCDPSQLKLVEQLYTFDTVARDPRGHAISITYMGLGRNIDVNPKKASEEPQFFPVSSVPILAFDHKKIIDYAITRLQSKLAYTNAVFALLDPTFTLTELQKTYEAILGRDLDKRNFRKKILSYELLQETGEKIAKGAHRPAMLYKFKQSKLEVLARSLD
jgi:8-oxo-dGTP diphosphatase